MRGSLLPLFLTLALTSCVAQPGAGPAAEPILIAQWAGPNDGGNVAGLRVLKTADEWTKFWQQVGRDAPRTLDPAREMAVVVALGEKWTGGYSVQITGVRAQDGSLIVDYRELSPPPGAMVTQALTNPWAAAVVTRSDLPVVARVASRGPGANPK